MENLNTGFIGCGAMGSAFIKGFVKQGKLSPQNVMIYDVDSHRVENLKEECRVEKGDSLEHLLNKCSLVFLAVKPGDFPSLLSEIKTCLREDHLFVSIAAGIDTDYISGALENHQRIIRVMPNTPCLIGEGAVAVAASGEVTLRELSLVEELVSALGIAVRVEEKYMNAVTGLSGSGPAYVYLFAESLIEGAVRAGLDRKIATSLAVQTLRGAAGMLLQNGKHPAVLKDDVTSPGGTTGAGLFELEENAFRAAVSDAVVRAAQRAQELGAKE